ncbi:uncharacterized protein LOC664114 isoform X3 [Tribolium castaneum]|uniref:uncharacterized protein LOC664114 isoform X3 n=1 Tax=Tribolium castaneum TaxID=7070 RepID=UPI00077DDE69|nr:PREDICTED: uncharacterized protein LOC664114 isoform X3 [Tribolium castaneum]|eukprot:XP_015839212.1 PREDICTED: uncharacterized protein LOC664114 isoform X3 [Tribolium castaneum]
MEVEVREEASPGTKSGDSTALLVNNTPAYPMADGPVVIVRVEEVLLVVLVLMIWVAAIALFFNRWGKIRMLEPYQPKFHQQPHRPSCPLAPLSPPAPQQRMSFSKYNVNAMTDPLSALPSPIIRRPRQNSVFVGSSTMAILNPPPRRVKSAIDIQHMVVNEHSPTSLTGRKGSVIPILNRDRRPSITIERPRHRPSIAILDRPPPPAARYRRSSCFVERPSRPHRNFISFEHPIVERKMSINIERPSCSYHQQPIVSFEAHVEPAKVDLPPKLPKLSRSFEQPPKERTRPERMANSLDVSSVSFDRRSSIVEEDRSSPVFICLDETRITAPLLEGLKSSDV